jgi:hypothetical protein
MKTLTINGSEVTLYSAQSKFAGHGHQKITVTLDFNGHTKEFSCTTNNMPSFDDAQELEGPEKELALFNIVENKLQDEIIDWIESYKNQVMYRLMNHDSSNEKPRFDKYTLEEHNKQFETNYNSIQEALDDDPEYLFNEEDMFEYINN